MHEQDGLPVGRRDRIAARLAAGQPVAAASLAGEFGVSEDAIRRDLRALAAQGLCRRVYGGALPPVPGLLPLQARLGRDGPRKLALAQAAAATVQAGEMVFLDAGSTQQALVACLPEDARLTVATNAPDIAAAVLQRGDLRLLMVGGLVDPLVGGCVDAQAVQAVQQLVVDRCFLGLCAVSAVHGLCAQEAGDAQFKRVLARVSRRVLGLATCEKLELRAPHRVLPLDALEALVVEADLPAAQQAALKAAGARLLLAEAP
ncbi:DeoR/GlpR family DNA-binding transcription regulator [Ideonella livida]|uniref:DeoR/GlpR transcriptional regulator n=1 Tax=Ideonella livida TaxID=2707176 RepID=A0A7C9PEZ4_9BURK|nr:DeoR/GlpR family DNA-binding transcription regulator [Ideonella livida]NDY90256.1 DeoR/GlpR transcriptional regulator [Ideonella livida]